jgi:integrase
LQCRVGANRTTWIFYHDDRRRSAPLNTKGERRRIISKRLGFFPSMRIEEARNAARVERGKVAAGDVGPGRRDAVKVETSLAEYVAYLERKSETKGKEARWARNVAHYVKKHINPRWGKWSLADLVMHPGAVADWHQELSENAGPVTADHCCRVLRAAYRRSAKRDPSLPQRSPASAVEYNPQETAQTAMPFRDFPKWLVALDKLDVGPKMPCRRQFHLWCLFTGCRPGEASRIRWRDVKPAERVVLIPGAKADKTIRVIMSAPIARILKAARDLGKPASADDFVFSHCFHAAHRDELPTRGHALRHTWKTVSADAGIDDLLSRLLLGHEPQGISEKYITRFVLAAGSAVRQAQRKVSRKIIQLLGSDPTR